MVVIGICTYNRLQTVKMMAKSLYASVLPSDVELRVYDDASTEYSVDELRSVFPNAYKIIRHPQNMGADANMRFMYEDFMQSEGNIFFNGDSDLIFRTDWLLKSLELLEETDGVLSVFNTPFHKPICCSDKFYEKEVLGAAGTFLKRDILTKIVNAFDLNQTHSFDWHWCAYIRQQNLKLYCTRESLVQHIGISGYNSEFCNFNYGIGFQTGTVENGQIINDVLEEIALNQKDVSLRFWYAVFPTHMVKPGSKIVIYGAGKVGRDYLQQLEKTGYCEVIAVVDKKTCGGKISDSVHIISPEQLKDISFDAIVLAAMAEDMAESMRNDIRMVNADFESQIIYAGDNMIRL